MSKLFASTVLAALGVLLVAEVGSANVWNESRAYCQKLRYEEFSCRICCNYSGRGGHEGLVLGRCRCHSAKLHPSREDYDTFLKRFETMMSLQAEFREAFWERETKTREAMTEPDQYSQPPGMVWALVPRHVVQQPDERLLDTHGHQQSATTQ